MALRSIHLKQAKVKVSSSIKLAASVTSGDPALCITIFEMESD
jgi:hypothetical protein